MKKINFSRPSLACLPWIGVFFLTSTMTLSGQTVEKELFFDDFSALETGAFPPPDSEWIEMGNLGRTFISELDGSRGLTFDTPPNERTSVVRNFSASETSEGIVLRFSIRFFDSTHSNDGMNVQFVPTVELWGGEFSTDPSIRLMIKQLGRIQVFTNDAESGDLINFSLDPDNEDGVELYHGSWWNTTTSFEEYTHLTLTYDASSGTTTLSGESDTQAEDFSDYTVEWQAQPGMTFDQLFIRSASSEAGDRGMAENYASIRDIGVSVPLDITLDQPAEKEIFTAAELVVPTEDGLYYQIESSPDLENWEAVDLFQGDGEEVRRFFSTREDDRRFFRVLSGN